jgi:hypothetical protein
MFADVQGPGMWGLKKVYATTDSEGRLAIGFELDENGARLFSQLTKNNVGNQLAILVDGKVLSIVKVTSALPEKGVIAGSFAQEDIDNIVTALRKGMQLAKTDVQVESGEEGENGTSDINEKIAQICSGPTDFNDVIRIFGQPSGYDYRRQSFKLEDLPVERYWIRYTDSIHIFMRWDKVDGLEIVDPAYVFNGKIPIGSSLERVLSIVGQPKETIVGRRGWEDGVLYKDINGRIGWCQYRREDLNADFRFLNYTLNCVHILYFP